MEQKKAILYLTRLHCLQETHEAGSDSIYMHVYCDDVFYDRFPSSDVWHLHTGDADSVDIEIECTYLDKVTIKLYERDSSSDDPDGGDETFHAVNIKRGDQLDANNAGYKIINQDDNKQGKYQLDFRVISDPIPTVRVLGIRCEAQSAGMNVALVEEVAGVASKCAKKSGEIIKKNPRPSRKLIGDAFIAVSKILKGLENFAEFIGGILEGHDDDVYMKHVVENSSRAYDGGFFPPDKDHYSMKKEEEIYFEEIYGHYFRFPLDTGKVTIELREYDAAKADIIIGSLIIDPEKIMENSTAGIEGGSPPTDEDVPPIEGGTAVMDGGAVVEVANSYYGKHNGEGALYHICYSVGMEDWCLDANSAAQEGPVEEGTLPDGRYKIIAKHSGMSLQHDDDWSIVQRPQTGDESEHFNVFERDSVYQGMKHPGIGNEVSVENNAMEDGARIILSWDQLLKFESRGNGYWSIRAKDSGKVFTVNNASQSNGTHVAQHTFTGEDHQLFKFVEV